MPILGSYQGEKVRLRNHPKIKQQMDTEKLKTVAYELEELTLDFHKRKVLSLGMYCVQSFSILCDLMDYSPPGSSLHGILQARILEWVAISFSRGSSSRPRARTCISCISRWILYHGTTWEGHWAWYLRKKVGKNWGLERCKGGHTWRLGAV